MNRAARLASIATVLILHPMACSSVDTHKPSVPVNTGTLPAPMYVGVTTDKPSVAYQDPSTGVRNGFDISLYRWIGHNSSPQFLPVEVDVNSEQRETYLRERRVSFVVSSYSIADFRENIIDFAGPYLTTQQGVMTRKEESLAIRGPRDLIGKDVCVPKGTTSAKQLKEMQIPFSDAVGLGECVQQLRAGNTQVVSTDQLLLLGYVRKHPELEVPINVRFGTFERWGIGLQLEDGDENCKFFSEKIRSFIIDNAWDAAFQANFGDIDPAPYRPDPNDLRKCVIDKESP